MKILLLGGSGMLGSDCKKILEKDYEVLAPDKKELDIISWDVVIENLHQISPDIILNCAGFTDVDACESEKFLVRKLNVEGPRNLAQGSARFNCRLVHISSDYVFNGQKGVPQPYFEDDSSEPLSAYAKSKMESEVAVRENAPNYVILRTGWLYGINRDNFIDAIIRKTIKEKKATLRLVNDQFGSPTWTYRLALQINELLKTDAKGTFHATAEGYCTPKDWAKHIIEKLNLKASIEECSLEDFPRKAKRPANCILENRLLKKMGLNIMSQWDKDLDIYLEKFGDELTKRAKEGK